MAEGKSESLHFRSLPGSKKEWCSIYSGKGNKEACKRSFVLYETSPKTYQTCKWSGGGDFSCRLDATLSLCETPPPSEPSPPTPPSPPMAPPPPSLCAALSTEKVSIRDLASPQWCTDLAADQAACENAYVRFGSTYVSCLYHPVDNGAHGGKNVFAPTCTMDTVKRSCDLSPPAPPLPPSVPATCLAAAHYGYEQDLRYTAAKLNLSDATTAAWNAAHHVDSRLHADGHTNYANCQIYRTDAGECKRSYQSDGDVWWPCLFKNDVATGATSCDPSPTARCCDTAITSAQTTTMKAKRLAAAPWQHAQGGCQPIS